MKLLKLFKELYANRKYRKNWKIKGATFYNIDDLDYNFCLIPTIVVQPWTRRHADDMVVTIFWLNMVLGIGKWVRVKPYPWAEVENET